MVVSVQFRTNPWKTYDYLTDLDLHKGDFVVVPTGPLGAGDTSKADLNHVTVVQVTARKLKSDKATAWVIGKVDMQGFLQKMKERKKPA